MCPNGDKHEVWWRQEERQGLEPYVFFFSILYFFNAYWIVFLLLGTCTKRRQTATPHNHTIDVPQRRRTQHKKKAPAACFSISECFFLFLFVFLYILSSVCRLYCTTTTKQRHRIALSSLRQHTPPSPQTRVGGVVFFLLFITNSIQT
jgi:hypothetical protein